MYPSPKESRNASFRALAASSEGRCITGGGEPRRPSADLLGRSGKEAIRRYPRPRSGEGQRPPQDESVLVAARRVAGLGVRVTAALRSRSELA